MSIATTTGDGGQTSLADGRRVSKCSDRVEAYGMVDELIAQIGLARATCRHKDVGSLARCLQRDLFGVADALARDEGAMAIDAARLEEVTRHVHRIEGQDGILLDWALPGEHGGAAAFDVARTVCRRTERAVVRLRDGGGAVHPTVLAFLNRLADLLWLLSRIVERDAGVDAALRQPGQDGARWSRAWP
jgi:cob(I)alamin adenosyltransferase